jgi:hypothetical protein
MSPDTTSCVGFSCPRRQACARYMGGVDNCAPPVISPDAAFTGSTSCAEFLQVQYSWNLSPTGATILLMQNGPKPAPLIRAVVNGWVAAQGGRCRATYQLGNGEVQLVATLDDAISAVAKVFPNIPPCPKYLRALYAAYTSVPARQAPGHLTVVWGDKTTEELTVSQRLGARVYAALNEDEDIERVLWVP